MNAKALCDVSSLRRPVQATRTSFATRPRALKGGDAITEVNQASAPATPAISANFQDKVQNAVQGGLKTLEKFDMVTAPPGQQDTGSKIIDTIASAGVPMVIGVAVLAVAADLYEKSTGKSSSTVRALFFDDPTQLNQDEDTVVQRVINRLGDPSTSTHPVADQGVDLMVYKRPASILTYKEQLALRTFFRMNHVPGWRKAVEADEDLKEDELKQLILLDRTLMDAGKPEVERLITARQLNNKLKA